MQEMFKDRLRRFREAAGLTKQALAGLTGCTPPFIGQMESGRKQPSLRTLKNLAIALGVSESELLKKESDNV